MASYRRFQSPGSTWFFTLATHCRRPALTKDPVLSALKAAIKRTRAEYPFEIVAWVVLPDHLHAIWTLPEGDTDYLRRWSLSKRRTSQAARDTIFAPTTASMRARREIGLWQRRHWEHLIRDEADLHRHIDYVHYNPVTHGHVSRTAAWPHSTFHRYVRTGAYPRDWAVSEAYEDAAIFGEPGS